MKKLIKTISLTAFLLISLLAHPLLACEEGFISLEDACSALYMGNRICLVEPQDGLNTNQDSICFRGKLMTYEDYKDVVDLIFAISYPSDIDNVSDVVRVPAIGEIQTEDGSFALTVGLPGEGLTRGEFQAIVHADFISGSQVQRISETRQLFRVGRPDMSILAARESGAASQSPYAVSQNDDLDNDGLLNSQDPDLDGDGLLNPEDPDDDNDHICDQTLSVAGICEAGSEPDPVATRESRIDEEEISASKIDLCIATTPGMPPVEGNDLLFSAVNEVMDDTDGITKVTRTTLQPAEVVSSDSDFCRGHIVTFPLGHGINRLEVEVNNVKTEGAVGQRIALEPFRNDMRGPKLCVKYYRDQNMGSEIPGVEGRILIADSKNPLAQVFVGVTSCEIDGEQEPLQDPLLVQVQHETDAAGQSVFDEMSKRVVSGREHFVAAVSPLQFPMNTYTIKAKDLNGNETIESHSFSFGKVRPIVDSTGKFDPVRGMVPEAISAYLPADYIQGELKATLLKILNSTKFKQEMLPDLFIPTPLPSSVLRHFQEKMGCDPVFSEDYTRVFKLYDTTVREIDIPRLELMDGNKARLTLEIKDLRSDVEFFVVNYIDSDDDGIMDIEDKDDDCHDTDPTRWNTANHCPSPDKDDEDEDLDDDGDGHLDTVDFPGELRTEPVLGTHILPFKMNFASIEIALELRIKEEDGKLKLEIKRVPNESLLTWVGGMEFQHGVKRGVVIDCTDERTEVRTHFNGSPGEFVAPQAGLSDDNDTDEDMAMCQFLRGQDLALGPLTDVDPDCYNQNLDGQLKVTLEQTLRHAIPHQIETALKKYEETPLDRLEFDLLDEPVGIDLYADINHASIEVSRLGIFLSVPGLLAPAADVGTNDPEADHFVTRLLEETIPEGVNVATVANSFGPVREKEAGEPVDPADAALFMGNEVNLGLSEEFVNSLLHTSNMLLYHLAQEKADLLDMSISRLREMGLASPNIGGIRTECFNKDGENVEVDQRGPKIRNSETNQKDASDSPLNDWECFPFSLDVQTAMGGATFLPGVAPDLPVIIRTSLDPHTAITTRILNISGGAVREGDETTDSPLITVDLELGLRDAVMSLYKGEAITAGRPSYDPEIVLKDICDVPAGRSGHQLITHPDCGVRPVPLARFKTSGKLTLRLTLLLAEEGLIAIDAGLATKMDAPVEIDYEAGTYGQEPTAVLDTDKTFINYTVIENNTLTRDTDDPDGEQVGIGTVFQTRINALLSNYLATSTRSIKKEIAAIAPLEDFCTEYAIPDLCPCAEKVYRIQHRDECETFSERPLIDFGIRGFLIDRLNVALAGSLQFKATPQESFGTAHGAPRHLLIGLGVCLKDENGRCVE